MRQCRGKPIQMMTDQMAPGKTVKKMKLMKHMIYLKVLKGDSENKKSGNELLKNT